MTTIQPAGVPPRRRSVILAIAGLLAAIAVLAIVALTGRMGPSTGEVAIGGPFSLLDGEGRTVTDRDLRGHYALVYFGYTFCPDVCPTTLSAMMTALDALGPQAERVRPVFVSIDPARDTPSVVRDYVAAFSPRLLGLTGSAEAIAQAARAYRVYYAPHRSREGDTQYTMDHSSILYLMDPDGALRSLIRTDQSAPEMAAEIRRALT